MSTTTTESIQFFDWHKPSIEAGDYTIEIIQSLEFKVPSEPNSTTMDEFKTGVFNFSIQGERFTVVPTEVLAVFPPDGSMGDHSRVLPHVVLRRNTLPWERRANPADDSIPWLALLVFHDDDQGIESIKTMSLTEAEKDANFPKYKPESGGDSNEQISIVDVQKDLLESILPTQDELSLLAHTRTRGDTQVAVVVSNRLPKANGFSTAYLVSLEGRYTDEGFDFQQAGASDKIRLVSLASFRFGCLDSKRSFTSLLRGLDGSTTEHPSSTLRLPAPANASEIAKTQLALGSVPMRHRLRNGETTASWYHGPLGTAKNLLQPTDASAPKFPIAVADQLLRYNADSGMFDASYAAAWEIGRLVALQNKKFSLELLRWKQDQAKQLHPSQSQHGHPLAQLTPPSLLAPLDLPMPKSLRDWLSGLSLLEEVPFSYLVPDEQMLPLESIRIFELDWLWIECLLDGAFSIGSATEADKNRDGDYWRNRGHKNTHGPVTGVILRSEVVSGWPGLQIDGYGKNDVSLGEPLRFERLSPNVLLCMFEREITKLMIHQQVEMLHFGVDQSNDNPPKLVKNLRLEGKGQTVELEVKDSKILKENRALNIKELKTQINKIVSPSTSITSAQFAIQMIEGVEEVTFSIKAHS